MTGAIVEAQHLGKSIDGKVVLRDVSLSVQAGSVVGIIGKNGAGKTTLLDVLLGFSPATTGGSKIFGSDSLRLPGPVKEKIGYVPQDSELIGQISAAEQLSLLGSLSARWDQNLVARLVKAWDIPLDVRVQELSSGAQQQLAVLLALGSNPELLVLDEPASSFDPIARRTFMQEIVDIAAGGARTVLFSTHLVSDLERVASQVVVIRAGSVVWSGDLDSLKESVVRLHITGRDPLPKDMALRHIVSYRSDGPRAVAVVTHWDAAQLDDLLSTAQLRVEVENMSLEDIFVEMHS